ncbi:MAG: sigma 54-interacting transcriptional regulator [Planctomycetota bacterium]|jgi:transcriptional regulator with GAF, ATPase, and Fis domain/Flp pilus assembly protein TadD
MGFEDHLKAASEKARQGALEEAVKRAEEAVSDAPPDAEGHRARLALARYLAELGEFDRAESLADGARDFASDPDDPALRSLANAVIARVAAGRGRFDEAVDLFRNALFEAPEGPPSEWRVSVALGLSLALQEMGDGEGARKEAERGLRDARETADSYLVGLATATAACAKVPQAEDALRDHLAEGHAYPPVDWFSHFALGEALSGRGDTEEAEREYASALKGLRSIWASLSPRRRSTYLSTAPLKRFCGRLVACAGEGPAFQAEATVVREIHRQVLEEAGGIELDGLEEVMETVGDPLLANRLESFRSNFRSLMSLQEVIKAVNSEQNLDRLLALIMDHAVEIAGAERGFMMLLEGKGLKFRIARNIDQEKIRKPEFKISHSIAEESFRTGKAILTANAKEDPRFAGAGSVHDLKLTSVLCLPLRIRERVTGVIYLDNRFRAGRFTQDVLRLLEMFGDQAAIALENARLNEENLASKEELLKLNRKLSDLNVHLASRVREQEEALGRARMGGPLPAEPRKYGPLVSRSPRMEAIFKLLDKVVESDVPVLVQGDSGTGKELVARVIHEKSARAARGFVSENCGALSDTLLESELFGHVRGAFTGAVADRVGLFELADGGTLLLDEVGEMSPDLQKKLLRTLQEGEIRPVGAKETKHVDVRVISASNRNLREMVKAGEFREDLYFRLNVLQIDLPPLREKPEDIPVLLTLFFGEGKEPEFDPAALRRVMRYRWPGNVRELRNFVERTKALQVEKIHEADLPPEMLERDTAPPGQDVNTGTLLEREESFMRGVIVQALKEAGYNKTKAAEALGIPKTTLYNKMKRYGIADEN